MKQAGLSALQLVEEQIELNKTPQKKAQQQEEEEDIYGEVCAAVCALVSLC
jgi:hypothetical protein